MAKKSTGAPKSPSSAKFNLYFFTPYSVEGKLGKACNHYMQLVPSDEDWVCFLDRDVMFLTPDFGHQMTEIIRRHPNAGLFTCLTNRIGCPSQLHRGVVSDDPNILTHRRIAEKLQRHQRFVVRKVPAPVSGFLMVLRKGIWRKIKFDEKLNLLRVDWTFSRRLAEMGYSIFVMQGVYVFHYYRLGKSKADTAHLV